MHGPKETFLPQFWRLHGPRVRAGRTKLTRKKFWSTAVPGSAHSQALPSPGLTHRPNPAWVTPQPKVSPPFRPPHGHWNRDTGVAGFQRVLYMGPQKSEKILEESSTSLREVGRPGRAGFSLLPASRHLSCFPKPGKRGPKEPYFVNGPFARFRSPPGMVQMFSQGPHCQDSPNTIQTNKNKQKVPTPGSFQGLLGFFFCRRR